MLIEIKGLLEIYHYRMRSILSLTKGQNFVKKSNLFEKITSLVKSFADQS